VVFIESAVFTRRLTQIADDEVLRLIQLEVLANPNRGRIVRGLGGIRKGRSQNPRRGKGKRGGFRYLYLYLKHKRNVHLLYLLDKDEQEDLDSREQVNLRNLVREIKKAGR